MSEEAIVHEVEDFPPGASTDPLVDGDFKLHDPKPQEVKVILPEPKKVLRPWYEMIDR
jgi:hypothetical protein